MEVTVLIDTSASMQTNDGKGKRIDVLKEFIAPIVEKVAFLDPNGIQTFTFDQTVKDLGALTPANIATVLAGVKAEGMATNTGAALKAAFSKIVLDDDPDLVLVLTDGAASDPDVLKSVIASKTKEMTFDGQLAILFVSFGHAADGFLKELDDNLKGASFDIVDSKNVDELIGLDAEQILNAAFND